MVRCKKIVTHKKQRIKQIKNSTDKTVPEICGLAAPRIFQKKQSSKGEKHEEKSESDFKRGSCRYGGGRALFWRFGGGRSE